MQIIQTNNSLSTLLFILVYANVATSLVEKYDICHDLKNSVMWGM